MELRSNHSLIYSTPQNSVSNVMLSSVSQPSYFNTPDRLVTPSLRENYYGQTLGLRSNFQKITGNTPTLGVPDLIHVGKYCGSRSSLYLNDDFGVTEDKETDRKDDEGYVGTFHFANGVSFDKREARIEKYILQLVGIEKEEGGYLFKKDTYHELLRSSKRELVVTFCTYNIFSRSDFMVKFVITFNRSSKRPVAYIDKSYQVVPNISRGGSRQKTFSYNAHTIHQLPQSYWEELHVSQIVRLFAFLDEPSIQLTGLVHYSEVIDSLAAKNLSLKLLIKFMPKGYMTSSKASIGAITASGVKGDLKVSDYKNYLVDAIIRICAGDLSGDMSSRTIDGINNLYHYRTNGNRNWDYVILRLLRMQKSSNREQAYLKLIHQHIQSDILTTQSALILQEQAKFLISKSDFKLALYIAQKAIKILPLDFDCWYTLVQCYILVGDYKNAMVSFNMIPLHTLQNSPNHDIYSYQGIKDIYVENFDKRMNLSNEPISEKTFKSFFPVPMVPHDAHSTFKSKKSPSDSTVEQGSIAKIWHSLFIFNPHLRHPIHGFKFYQSPLMNASPRELSSVHPNLRRICDISSLRNQIAAFSSGYPGSSLLDFMRTSTWGRCYDLLSEFIAIVGWDEVVRLKEIVFRAKDLASDEYVVNHELDSISYSSCEEWLNTLFLIVYEDLKILMTINNNNDIEHHSALEWGVLGLLGWSVKYNIKDSICSMITSVIGKSDDGGFDYFSTVKLLEIYDEFVLSDFHDSIIDLYHDGYNGQFFCNKLILSSSNKIYKQFAKFLEEEYFTLDFILLNLLKLISWNLRWYQYTPNYLITKILTQLCIKYDSIFIRSSIKMVFQRNKRKTQFRAENTSHFNLLGGKRKSDKKVSEFIETDTIIDYTEKIIASIEA